MSLVRNKLSKLFRPVNVLPKNVEMQYGGISKSQKLMMDMGFIRAASPGFFHLLPLGERALQKLINIVDKYMQTIGAQKMLLPLLTNAQLWKASVQAASGIMGGTLSHEYHFISEAGEDRLYICESCSYVVNEDIFSGECPECKSKSFKKQSGIEVGHTFLLGTRYSAPLKAAFQTSGGTNEILQMGCFGLGLTRILAAVIESLSLPSEIRLPISLAPFRTLIIPPKEGSKESFTSYLCEELYDTISSVELFKNDVMIDDRCHLTIGKRLIDGRKSGFPFIIIVGKKAIATPPCFELHDVLNNMEMSLPLPDLIKFLQERVKEDFISEMRVPVSSSV